MPLDSLHIVTEETALEEALDEAAPAEAEIEAAKEDVEPVAEGAAAGEIESIAEEAEAEKTGADLKESETEKAEASVEQPEAEQKDEAKKQEAETESTEKADAEPTDSDTDTDKFSNGSIVSGTVLNVNFQQAEIDLGEGEIGVLSGRHYSAGLIVDLTGELKAGDEIEAAVLIRADHNNRVVLSRTWARSQRAWKKIMEAKKGSTIIEAVIMEEVKGGFSVVIDDALGFLPSSLVVRSELTKAASQDADSGDASEDKSDKSEDASAEEAEETSPAAGRSPGEFSGQVVKCKVIEAKPDKTRYVLSHKAAVRTEQKQKEKERIAGLEKGTIVSGKVVSLEDFGAFVDIGGVRGLLHRTEMAWNHPNEPREILEMGESVFCKIIKINQQKAQVGLSLCFGENPISKVEVGQRLIGKVDRLAYAGAIVALEIPDGAAGAADEGSADGVSADGDETDSEEEGGSESANGEAPVSEGAEAGEASEPDEAGESAETESSEPASVNSTASNQPSDIPVAPTSPKCLLHGFVHVSEMSEYPIRRPQRVVLPGDEVAVKVIEVQRKQRRIGLSIIDAVVPDDLDEPLPQDEKLPEDEPLPEDEKSSPEAELADVSNDVSNDEVAASEETSSSEAEESVDEDDLETAEKESPPQEDSSEDVESSSAETQDS